MKKILTLLLFAATLTSALHAQQARPYDPSRNAMQQIDEAVALAQKTGRYVLCQVGYNACPWCLRFAQYADTCQAVHQLIDSNFVYIHVNYSKENRNPEAMKRLANPARFGFPVFVILDEKGQPIHIQNSAYLEEGKGYSRSLVLGFLNHWTPKAVTTLK